MTPEQSIDSGDLDALKELEQSPGYWLFKQRILDELERLRNDLEQMQPEILAQLTRGKINALRLVLQIPSILIGEVKTELEK